ncbi:hypothetical protein SEPCBS119000_005752 [Sporothrix epigloea]|uniref:Uncharacterized protein n=1 Tax=Sporothrix epigloea TaxID=1892477 RepID=A0ABP0DZ91_9PEZI
MNCVSIADAAPPGSAIIDVRKIAATNAMPVPPPAAKPACASQVNSSFLANERPTTPTSPVQIPIKTARHETAHPHAHAHAHHSKHRHHQRKPDDNQGEWLGLHPARAPAKWAVGPRRSSRDVHSPEFISPSVAMLLAVTTIPRSRSTRSLHRSQNFNGEQLYRSRMTDKSIIDHSPETEEEFRFSLSKSPLDVLLTAPEDLDEDDSSSVSDSTLEPDLSTRTVSLDSVPSLASSFTTSATSSYDSPRTPNRGHGSVRKARPTRRSMTPVSSPPGECRADPLSAESSDRSDDEADVDVDSLDFRVFQSTSPDPLAKTTEARLQPLRSAFKSNLTASLRALRNAARSFSSLNLTSIPPEDFLTRSILTIDPCIPYTDERRPPPLEEEPSPALRRYLNPSNGPHIDPRHGTTQVLSPALAFASLSPVSLPTKSTVPPGVSSSTFPTSPINRTASSASSGSSPPLASPFTASIQMQTYRVHRTKGVSSRSLNASSQSRSGSSVVPQKSGRNAAQYVSNNLPPGPRQRELRENSDFIRIAVMEMAMRRAGKLDDRKPGRARLALPSRKTSTKPYVIGADGVPARWTSFSMTSD